MKKLYMEYFKISDDARITDKAMLGRVIVTVAVMLVCVIAMSITAFAYFTSDASSSVTPIQTAAFDVGVSVDNNSVDVLNGLGEGSYNITLTVKDTSTAKTGYCVVTIGGKEYITEQFIRSEGGYNTVTFALHLAKNSSTNDGTTPIAIQTNWGTSSVYADAMANNAPSNYIVDQAVIDLVPKAQTPTPQPQPENNETADQNGDEVIAENQDENNQQSEE